VNLFKGSQFRSEPRYFGTISVGLIQNTNKTGLVSFCLLSFGSIKLFVRDNELVNCSLSLDASLDTLGNSLQPFVLFILFSPCPFFPIAKSRRIDFNARLTTSRAQSLASNRFRNYSFLFPSQHPRASLITKRPHCQIIAAINVRNFPFLDN